MKKILLTASLFLALTACGKRGRLDFPKGSVFPVQTYPAPHGPEDHKVPVSVKTPEEGPVPGLMDTVEQLEREADDKQ